MKSLQAFWHWVDNERPDVIPIKALDTLSEAAECALDHAVELVCARIDFDDGTLDEVHAFWPAIRDLSLTLCEAVSKMHEAVPEDAAMEALRELYPPERVAAEDAMAEHMTSTLQRQGMIAPGDGLDPIYRREYLGDWIPLQPPALDTFRGVERTPPEKLQGGMPKWYRGIDLGADASEDMRRAQLQLQANLGAQPRRCPDPKVEGRVRSGYSAVDNSLEIFVTVTLREIDSFRGLTPSTIFLRGGPRDYSPEILDYLRGVVGPMLVDRPNMCTPEDPQREWSSSYGFGQ